VEAALLTFVYRFVPNSGMWISIGTVGRAAEPPSPEGPLHSELGLC